uniref:Metalloendopeptidase n=1 Tax=Periophthalmus magnuspinnatus TaxID=409849 RepID=A0A3B4B637_9GOBI
VRSLMTVPYFILDLSPSQSIYPLGCLLASPTLKMSLCTFVYSSCLWHKDASHGRLPQQHLYTLCATSEPINHTLGFHDKKNQRGRHSYVTVNWNNMKQQMAYNFFLKSTNNQNTPYDCSSVMHYGRTAFSISGQDTIILKPDPSILIGQRQCLSFSDVQRINLFYNY